MSSAKHLGSDHDQACVDKAHEDDTAAHSSIPSDSLRLVMLHIFESKFCSLVDFINASVVSWAAFKGLRPRIEKAAKFRWNWKRGLAKSAHHQPYYLELLSPSFIGLDLLPPNLLELVLAEDFCEPLQNLPGSLRTLTLKNGNYAYPLDSLPPNLSHLTIGSTTSVGSIAPLDDLPPNLRSLTLMHCLPTNRRAVPLIQSSCCFDHLPPSLVHLKIKIDASERNLVMVTFDNLPDTLEELELTNVMCWSLDHLPSSLRCLSLLKRCAYFACDQLPRNLKYLTLGNNLCPLSPDTEHYIDHLPPNLHSLVVARSYVESVDHLPETLRILRFRKTSSFNRPVDNLPSHLDTLIFGVWFDLPIDHLPESLRILRFPEQSIFDRPVDCLPSQLHTLVFGRSFEHSIDHLPLNLVELTVGLNFIQPVNYLPPKLVAFSIVVDNCLYRLQK